jgi:hypothetical protein
MEDKEGWEMAAKKFEETRIAARNAEYDANRKLAEAKKRLRDAAPDAHELLTELRAWFEEESTPRPDAMFDDAMTWYQKLTAYFAKVEA